MTPSVPNCSDLSTFIDKGGFIWCTGIEDTFIVEPHPTTGRTLEEYELTDHYARWRADLSLAADLGVQAVRYGIPWYRVQPSVDRWDWSWPDKTLGYLIEKGIEPIVDLVHYGVPPWLERGLLDPSFPQRMAEYASRLAERFKGRVHWYTPLNEPRINAWYCGKIGWWPPYLHGWSGYLQVSLALARAIVLTHKALKALDREIVTCHVDASDIYFSDHVDLAAMVTMRQDIVFLALDLVMGRLSDANASKAWLGQQGVESRELEWFVENAVQPDVIGINAYPMFSLKELLVRQGRLRIKMHYGDGQMLERIVRMYWERYRCPIMISETAAWGRAAKRSHWLGASVQAVRRLRSEGVPLIGYTWWPLYSLVAWAYRQGKKPLSDYLLHMGLYDLSESMDRVETAVARDFAALSSRGAPDIERRIAANAIR